MNPYATNEDVPEACLVWGIYQVASMSRNCKVSWYYNDDIKEANHSITMYYRNFLRHREPENPSRRKEVGRYVQETAIRVK